MDIRKKKVHTIAVIGKNEYAKKKEAALAILTAEHEPCDDALALVEKLEETRGMSCLTPDQKASMIDAYASQVSDKRAEELRAQVETLRDHLAQIKDQLEFVELPTHYNEDQVRRLDCAATESYVIAEETLAATEPKTSDDVVEDRGD